MDSTTVLDYALFQLTPTRTRCDLVIFARKNYEKIASGLLEPYLSNLRSAKDQFSKGGYSITLKPADSDASSWFTKSTLERFVRFVNTPEVLERFVTIEREIEQIDRSIEQNEAERVDGDYAKEEEHPKVRLQSVLESRKSVLKKEQAMAYARAIVMGFDTNAAYDLVIFSEAFGAVRLREACTNFIELRHKKNDDTIWMNEVALMQESYNDPNHGLYNSLSVETEYRVKEKIQTWANHPQQYHTPQVSMYQQIPPYHGCLLPGSYYPRNFVWPSNNFQDSTNLFYGRDSKDHKRYESKKKSKKNDDRSVYKNSDYSSDERDRELNISSRKNKKNSFVVRSVDCIAGADFSDEDGGYVDSDLIKQKVDEEDTCDGEKKDLDWDIFQNLLMKSSETENADKGSNRSLQVREDYSSAEHVRDKFLSSANECGVGELEKDPSMELEKFNGVVNKKSIEYYEELLFPPRMEEEYDSKNGVLGSETSVTKHHKEDDWFIGNNKQERSDKIDHAILFSDQENVLGISQCKAEDRNFDEPEDLYVVLRRDSAAPEKVVRSSWNPEMDFVNDNHSPLETVEIKNKTEDDTSNRRPNTKPVRKMDPKSKSTSGGFIGRSRPDAVPSRRKTSSTVSRKIKSEADKEEEKRKKLEELKIQRQKRIAERTAAKAVTTSENTSKKLPAKETIKKNVVTKKTEKIAKKLESPSDDIRKSYKPTMISNATIDRLSAARTLSNKSRVLVQNEKPSSKKTNAVKSSSSKTVKGTQFVQGKANTSRTVTTSVSNKLKARSDKATRLEPKNNTSEDFEDVKVLHTVISVEKAAPEESYRSHHHLSKDDASSDDHDKVDPIKHSSDDHHRKTIIDEPSKQIEMQHKIDSPSVAKFDTVIKGNDVKPSVMKHSGNNGDHQKRKKLSFSPELSVVHIISSDNRVIESDEEAALSRNKWSDDNGSAKAAPKGFRKLLFFGRRI